MDGIDISSYQSGIDLAAVPCDFAVVKATQGTWYTNPDCDRAVQQCRSIGKCWGVYHYVTGEEGEADYFVEQCRGYVGEGVLALDWEEVDNGAWGDVGYLASVIDRVVELTGVKPLVYAQASVYGDVQPVAAERDCGMWVAQYANTDATGYQDSPWNEDSYGMSMFQYSSAGSLEGWGGSLDLDKFYGDEAAWHAYATASAQPTAEPQPVQQAQPQAQAEEADYAASTAEAGWLPFVHGLDDFAGNDGQAITYLAIDLHGHGWYQACTQASGWLPAVRGCDTGDLDQGCAGDGSPIVGVRVYYETPDPDATGWRKAEYRVKPVGGDYYDWQHDDDTDGGQDGYAGDLSSVIDRFQLHLV